jgi:hypothetical protein
MRPDTRRIVAVSVVVVLVATSAAAIANAPEQTRLDVTPTVVGYGIDSNDSINAVTVELANTGTTDETVVLRVWGRRDHRQHIWPNASGHDAHSVAAGERRVVTITRQKFELRVKPTQPVMVTVTTPDGTRRSSTVFRAQKAAGGQE